MSALGGADLERIRAYIARMPDPGAGRDCRRKTSWGAAVVLLLAFVATLPVVVPFMLFSDAVMALRASNAVAVAMMLCAGYAVGRLAGHRP